VGIVDQYRTASAARSALAALNLDTHASISEGSHPALITMRQLLTTRHRSNLDPDAIPKPSTR
jgi:hypothetical protein